MAVTGCWGGGSYVDEFLTESVRLRNALIGMSVAGAIAMLALIQLMASSRFKRMGTGDLTLGTGADPLSRNEADRIGASIDKSRESMRKLLLGVAASARKLSAESNALAASTKTANGGPPSSNRQPPAWPRQSRSCRCR